MTTRHIEIDSTYRNRKINPTPTDFTVHLQESGSSLSGETAIDGVSNQVIVYPPQNPIGASQLQLEPVAYYNENTDDNHIASRLYLPYMFRVSDASETLLRLDELPIASTDITSTSIVPSTDLPRNTIPLRRADNAYIGRIIENMSTKETREIIGFSYSDVQSTLHTVEISSYSISGTNIFVELDIINNTKIPSNIDRFYQGKLIEFADETQKLITNFFQNSVGKPILQIESPLLTPPTVGTRALIIAPESWLARIDRPFSTDISSYPAYRISANSIENIIYSKNEIIDTSTVFAMDTIRHDTNVGVVIQTSTKVQYVRSLDADGREWSQPVDINSFPTGYTSLGQHGIGLTRISGNPTVVFGSGVVAPPVLSYARCQDRRGVSWNSATEVRVIELSSDTLVVDPGVIIGSGDVTVSMTDGYYNSLDTLATEIETELTATGQTFTVSFDSDGIITITSPNSFTLESSPFALELGFTTFGVSGTSVTGSQEEQVSEKITSSDGQMRIQPIPAQGVSGTGSPTDAGFPEIAVSHKGVISIVRGRSLNGGTIDSPTWVIDYYTDNPVPGQIDDMSSSVEVSVARYNNAALDDNLMNRTLVVYRYTQDGFIVRPNNPDITFDDGTATTTTMSNGYYETLAELASEIETKLQAEDGTFTVTVSGGTFTIARSTNFTLVATNLSQLLGFGDTDLTGSDTYTSGANQLDTSTPNQLGIVFRNAPNGRWNIDSVLGNEQSERVSTLSTMATTVPVGVEDTTEERELNLLVLVYTDSANVLTTRVQKFILATETSQYRGLFNPAFETEFSSSTLTALNPKVTNFITHANNIYPTSESAIFLTYINENSIRTLDYIPNTLQQSSPYTTESAVGINIFDTIVNIQENSPLIIFQSQNGQLSSLVPTINNSRAIDYITDYTQNAITSIDTFNTAEDLVWNVGTGVGSSIVWAPELSIFVAVVGISDTANPFTRVYTSPNGFDWTARTATFETASWTDVVWSPELKIFVAVTSSNRVGTEQVMTSPDGINWTARDSSEQQSWNALEWTSDLGGIFVAVSSSDKVMTSSDGINWTSANAAVGLSWLGIVWSYDLSIFVACGSSATDPDRIMTSPDGTNWTSRSHPSANALMSVEWSSDLGIFVIVSSSNITPDILTSTDGITWTARSAPITDSWSAVEWSSDLGIFIAVSGSNIMTSSDGINWSLLPTINLDSGEEFSALTWSPDLGVFTVIGDSPSMVSNSFLETITADTKQSIIWAQSENQFVLSTNTNPFAWRSSDGVSWSSATIRDLTTTNTLVFWLASITTYALLYTSRLTSGNYTLATSTDADAWTDRVLRYYTQDTFLTDVWRDIVWSPSLEIFCAVGDTITAVSSDGINWDDNAIPLDARAVAWSPDLDIFCIVGDIAGSAKETLTSSDGITWQRNSASNIEDWYDIVWSSTLGIFCAVGTNSSGVSDDGVSWTVESNSQTFRSVAWSPTLNLFGATALSNTNIYVSLDGLNWTGHEISSSVSDWSDITWSSDLKVFCAVGSTFTAISDNGEDWVFYETNLGSSPEVIWASELGLFIATNGSDTFSSTDGLYWTTILNSGWDTLAWSPTLEVIPTGDATGLSLMTIDPATDLAWSSSIPLALVLLESGASITSANATTWSAGTTLVPGRLTWSSDLAQFVLLSHSTQQVGVSTDGTTWSYTDLTLNDPVSKVEWISELNIYCAITLGGEVYISNNGFDWTVYKTLEYVVEWQDIAWSPSLSLIVIVGNTQITEQPQIAVSEDGISWTSLISPGSLYTGVAWSSGLEVFAITSSTNESPVYLLEIEKISQPIGIQYRIRESSATIQGTSSEIISGTVKRLTVSSGSGVSATPGKYNGSFLYIGSRDKQAFPDSYHVFNDYRNILKWSGNKTDTTETPSLPPYTFLVSDEFSADTSTTSSTDFEITSRFTDLKTGITTGLTDASISTGTYSNLTAVLTALETELNTTGDTNFTVTDFNKFITISNSSIDFSFEESELSRLLGFFGEQSGSNSYTGSFEASFINTVEWEVLEYDRDSFSPLIYMGSKVTTNQMVCYEIELTNLSLPNLTLASGRGNRIAFYPYVYVEFTNLTSSSNNILISNNPNSAKVQFRVPITNFIDPERATFVSLSGRGKNVIPFKPNDSFRFRVTLDNGELFRTLETDTVSPFEPDPNIQVSASFAIKRLENC